LLKLKLIVRGDFDYNQPHVAAESLDTTALSGQVVATVVLWPIAMRVMVKNVGCHNFTDSCAETGDKQQVIKPIRLALVKGGAVCMIMGDNARTEAKEATQTYPKSQYPNLSFICMDARSLDFKQEFDLIFSNAVLHWVDDHQAFLNGAKLALRDRGRLIISCGGKGNAAGILQVFNQIFADPKWNIYSNRDFCNPHFFYVDREYRLWLQESGFAINRLELVPKDMTHNGPQDLAGWIRTAWMPFTNCVPESKRDDFINDFVDLYLQRFPLDSEGMTHVNMVRLEVDAIKA